MQWYVERNLVRKGPIPDEQMRRHIQAGHLRETDLVWCSADPEWRRAAEIDGLLISPPASAPETAEVAPSQKQKKPTVTGSAWPGAREDALRPTGSYLADHWSGRQGLVTSFWINTFTLGILLPVLAAGLFLLVSALPPPFSFMLILCLPLLYLAVLIWQHVGLYRCALAHIFVRGMRMRLFAHLALIWSVLPIATVPMISVALITAIAALGHNTSMTFNEIAAQL